MSILALQQIKSAQQQVKLFMLMTRQAADLIYGNGEAPQDPKPAGCCKHLVMAFQEMLNQKILRPDMTYRELKK